MNRRDAIQRTALALGYIVAAPLAGAVLNGCKAKPGLAYVPKFFNEDQARLMTAIAEAILPKTDTPGATEAGVPAFIDDMVGSVYNDAEQKNFTDGLTKFSEEAEVELGEDFTTASPEQQLSFVKKVNEQVLSGSTGAASEGWWAAGMGKAKPFFLDIKELTILGFFTSEPGATQVLQYNQSPGPFKGCVPLADVGKAWAT